MWYVSKNNQQIGPLDERDIAVGLAQGDYGAQTMVWRAGWTQWCPITQCELAKYLPRAAIPGIDLTPTSPPLARKSGSSNAVVGFFLFVSSLSILGLALDRSKKNTDNCVRASRFAGQRRASWC